MFLSNKHKLFKSHKLILFAEQFLLVGSYFQKVFQHINPPRNVVNRGGGFKLNKRLLGPVVRNPLSLNGG